MLKNKIIWEKWEDPFAYDGADDTEEDYLSYEDEEEQPEASSFILYSSMGIIPYNEKMPSSKIFNFWVGHTNFDITQRVQEIISEVRGVEILDIFTRYRFRVAIAKAFKDRDVMNDISNALSGRELI